MLQLPLSELIRRACILEARARKPGNVHPGAAFADLAYDDFVLSAEALAATLPAVAQWGIGSTILAAVRKTKELVKRPTNPNLGIILLLTPLVAVPPGISLAAGIPEILERLTVDDARQVYAAIALAKPGGMGTVEEADIAEAPTISLREAMRLAANRDSIASEYVTGFQIVLETGVPFLAAWPDFRVDWEAAIIQLQLTLMSRFPDTLIARKCGVALAAEAGVRAQRVLDAGGLQSEPGWQQLGQLDAWLRADGHRRNPGTTADLIAASLFAAARDGMIPFDIPLNP